MTLNSPSQRSCSPKSALKSTMSLCCSCLGRKEKSESTKKAMTARTRAHALTHTRAEERALLIGVWDQVLIPLMLIYTHTHVTT